MTFSGYLKHYVKMKRAAYDLDDVIREVKEKVIAGFLLSFTAVGCPFHICATD